MVDSIVTGIEAVAKHFGKSVRQVHRWAREGMPRLSQKRYDLLQIQEWLEKRKTVVRPGPKSGYQDPNQLTFMDQTGAGKDYEELRHKKAKADLAEMEVKERRRELVRRREIEQLFVTRIIAVKQGLLTLARSLPPRLIYCQDERQMEIIITEAVRDLLGAFSQPLPAALGSVAVEVEELPSSDHGGNGQKLTDGGAKINLR